MICKIKNELKIAGSNLYIISMILVVFLVFLAVFAGELLNISSVGFEVIFPFYAAIAVGEWGKTKSDDNYDVIVAQSKSVFEWLAIRYIAVMGMVSIFAVIGMASVSLIRNEMTLIELLLTYFPTAFLLSSLSMSVGIHFGKEHIATTVCGVIWLVFLMIRGLLRIPIVQYIYLFIRFSGIESNIWIINKSVLFIISIVIWCEVYWTCKKYYS